MADGQYRLAGGAALAKEDLRSLPEHLLALHPWLISVYTVPQYRNRGIASRLVQMICDDAKGLGYSQIYCKPCDASFFFADTKMQCTHRTNSDCMRESDLKNSRSITCSATV
jgi:GNAT superfamily N-acetyltransferase